MAATTTTHGFRTVMQIILAGGRVVKVALTEMTSVEWIKSHMVDVVATLEAHFPPGRAIPEDPVYLSIPQNTQSENTAQNTSASRPTSVANQTERGSKTSCLQTEGGSKTTHSGTTAVRHEWTGHQTRKLIDLVDQRLERLKSARNKQSIWMEIAKELSCDSITGTKCEDKWKNLKKGYRDFVQKVNCTGAAPSKFDFAEEMGKVLGSDPSVKPKFTLDSETTAGGDTEDTEEDEEINLEKTCTANAGSSGKESASYHKRKRSSTGVQEMIAYMEEKNKKMMEHLNSMHAENMKVMNKIANKL